MSCKTTFNAQDSFALNKYSTANTLQGTDLENLIVSFRFASLYLNVDKWTQQFYQCHDSNAFLKQFYFLLCFPLSSSV